MTQNPILALLQSRKFLACLLAVAACTVLCALGKLAPSQLAETITVLTAALVTLIGYEDGKKAEAAGYVARADADVQVARINSMPPAPLASPVDDSRAEALTPAETPSAKAAVSQ